MFAQVKLPIAGTPPANATLVVSVNAIVSGVEEVPCNDLT
jgi:hypothetical protein